MIDDFDELARRLAAWLEERHPERAPVTVTKLERSDAGYSNVTVLGELAWMRDGAPQAQPVVLRVQPPLSSVYPDCDIVRQYRVMEGLAGSDVPVPRLLGLEADPARLGAPFFLMERIEGRVPNENPLYHLEGWFHDLSADERRRHWFSGIDTLAAVARVDWRARGLDELCPPAGQSPLERQLAYYRDAVAWAERLGRPYPHLHAAYAWLVANQPTDEPMALSWGDAKLGNCVYRDGRVVGALDWEQATLASPVDDLAWWLMLDESLSTGYGVPRLAALPAREETVAHWERTSGFSARHLPYYDVFAAWRMAYVMARIGTVFIERGWVPRESGMDLRNGGAALLAMHAARLGF
ncbi:MAG: phosphotransferase family protein [Rubrivivax sp.]|jgi:aminoglycoside phosphotransferase (APT) family kinase protein|nr:phosphotransferase family protein [Rubrivivax sp.]